MLRHLDAKTSDLEKYIYLTSLADRNEKLFYYTVMSDPARFIPILYDPTVADACEAFGHIYRRPSRHVHHSQNEGPDGRSATELAGAGCAVHLRLHRRTHPWARRHWRQRHGYPIGKLQIYTACAGVPPQFLLPVLFDIGTTNAALRADPLYLGIREVPPAPQELDELVEEFVDAVEKVFPECCIHFEDWKGTDAIRYLDRYRDRILCYNDDIQGTASIVLAGLMTAMKVKESQLTSERILFVGAGSAATGIAKLIAAAMQTKGLSETEAHDRVAMFDIDGLVVEGRASLDPSTLPWAKALPQASLSIRTISRPNRKNCSQRSKRSSRQL